MTKKYEKYPLNRWVQTTRKINGKPTFVWILRRKVRGKNTYLIRQLTPTMHYRWEDDPRNQQVTGNQISATWDLETLREMYHQADEYIRDLGRIRPRDDLEKYELQRKKNSFQYMKSRIDEKIQAIASVTPTELNKRRMDNQIESKILENRRLTPQTIRALKELSEGDKEFGGGINVEDRKEELPQKIVARKGSTTKGSLADEMQITFHTHPPRYNERIFEDHCGIKRNKNLSPKSRVRIDQVDKDLLDLVRRACVSTNVKTDSNGKVVGMDGDLTAFDVRERIDPTLIVAGNYVVKVVDTRPSENEQTRAERAKKLQAGHHTAKELALEKSNLNFATSVSDLERRAKVFKKEYIRDYQNACKQVGLDCTISTRDSVEVPIFRRRTDYLERRDYRPPIEEGYKG